MSEAIAAVERAARAYIDSITTGTELEFLTGELAYIEGVLEEAVPSHRYRRAAEIHHLSVRSVDGNEAIVDCQFSFRSWFPHRLGDFDLEGEGSGPMTLRLVDGRWRVADYIYDGRSAIESYFIHNQQSVHFEGATLQVLVTALGRGRYDTLLRLRNDRQHSLWAREVFKRLRIGWLRAGALVEDISIGPGEERVLKATIPVNTTASRAEPTDTHTPEDPPPLVADLAPARNFKLLIPLYDTGDRRWLHPCVNVRFSKDFG